MARITEVDYRYAVHRHTIYPAVFQLTERQKILLAMQSNLDQIEAAIRQGLDDPKCAGERRDTVEAMRALAEVMRAALNRALSRLHI